MVTWATVGLVLAVLCAAIVVIIIACCCYWHFHLKHEPNPTPMMGPDGTMIERTLGGKFLYYFRVSDGEIIRDSDGEIVAEGNLPPREGNLPPFHPISGKVHAE